MKVGEKCIPGRVKSEVKSPAEGKSLVGLRTSKNTVCLLGITGGEQ